MHNVEYFNKAQELHKSIMEQRRSRSYNLVGIPTDVLLAATLYTKLIFEHQMVESPHTLISQYRALHNKGILLEPVKFDDVCVISAVAVDASPVTTADVDQQVKSYLTLRTAVLEYLIEVDPPVWKDDKIYHSATGVCADGYKYALEHSMQVHYEI